MRILIVEDNKSMRQMIKKLAGDLTEAFTEFGDGAQALGAYEQCRPDWILIDIKMKEMDGLAPPRQITSAIPNARIVIVTATTIPDCARRLRSQGPMSIKRICSSYTRY